MLKAPLVTFECFQQRWQQVRNDSEASLPGFDIGADMLGFQVAWAEAFDL